MVRKYMAEVIPVEHPVWKQWMDPASRTVDSKSLMRMRIRDSYREVSHNQLYSWYPANVAHRWFTPKFQI